MKKPILATTLSGLFIKNEPWEKAHILWYENAANQLKDPSVKEWANRQDYFKGVDQVMKRLQPTLSDEQRTIKARETFFQAVVEYIKQHPATLNLDIIRYFQSLKTTYRLALITTNTLGAIQRILTTSGLENLFDIIETSLPQEKDDKKVVFQRFLDKHGKPVLYIGGGRKDSYNYCQEKGIQRLYANLEGDGELLGVESVHNLQELKTKIDSLR